MGKVATGPQIAEVAGILARHDRGFDMAQAVIERQARVLEGQGVAAMPFDEFKGEEVPSTYGYPDDYKIGNAVEEAARLKKYFPRLDVSHVEHLTQNLVVPAGWDGVIVIPKFSAVEPVGSRKGCDSFHLAFERLIGIMKEARADFVNYMEGNIGPEYLRLHWRTFGAMAALEALTPGDVLVFPAQTGIIHRGRSMRRARVILTPREFSLDPFTVGVVVLLHPERLQSPGNILCVDCAGSEYAPDAVGRFTRAPIWVWSDGTLRLYWLWADLRHEHCGSASGLLPECIA